MYMPQIIQHPSSKSRKIIAVLKVLGLGQEWEGGDVKVGPGGAYKIRLLREELKGLLQVEEKRDLIVLFTDSYDVILLGGKEQILEGFLTFRGKPRVVFGAEKFCWPDPQLASNYSSSSSSSSRAALARYLNSGGFIGYASDLYEMVGKFVGKDTDDDQLFYTKVFLDDGLRLKHKIALDTMSAIFQNMNGATGAIAGKC